MVFLFQWGTRGTNDWRLYCPCKDSTTQLIINFVTHCADKVRFFNGWCSPLRPLCALAVPPNATQAHPVIFRLLVMTDRHHCHPDGILCFSAILFLLPLQHSDLLSFVVQVLSCPPTPLLAISPAFEQNYHPLQTPRKPSCCKVCGRERTRHKQTEIPRLCWNLNSHFHSFWRAHFLWQRNQLSFLRTLRRQFC